MEDQPCSRQVSAGRAGAAAVRTNHTHVPGVVAELSGKLNFHPIPMTGHVLCRGKATTSCSKPCWRHTPCQPPSQPPFRAPSMPRHQPHIPPTASPGRALYPRNPDPPGLQHKGLRAAKIQGGAATCKEKRIKSESSNKRAQLPFYPKPPSPHP